MFPDAETAPCSECAYPTTIFISGAVSVCILIFLLAFYRNNVLKDDGSSSSLPGSGTAIRAMETLPREEPTQGTACNPRVVELWVVSYG
ncbi:uncharacterized protein A4U43_C07F24310 [Asparagus officinalis]|uniref:Uncharacterized protein n=1 Tax=Asparagus officinalis TaxID=4686 RepID=A0A5P1EEH5_ASPOF|nr:uncharacterized protein A4U43_C07F24310 [Asparagus officinalis]